MPEVDKSIAPAEIRGENRHLLFGNLEIISMFHDVQFKTDLNEADKTPDDIASCFIKHVSIQYFIFNCLQVNKNAMLLKLTQNSNESFKNSIASFLYFVYANKTFA